MSVRSHETQFEQNYEQKTKNGVGVSNLLAPLYIERLVLTHNAFPNCYLLFFTTSFDHKKQHVMSKNFEKNFAT